MAQRVDKIFSTMDHNKDHKLTYEEFEEGSRKDPTIVQALSLYDGCAIVSAAQLSRTASSDTASPARRWPPLRSARPGPLARSSHSSHLYKTSPLQSICNTVTTCCTPA